jgi:hypothetical protein
MPKHQVEGGVGFGVNNKCEYYESCGSFFTRLTTKKDLAQALLK